MNETAVGEETMEEFEEILEDLNGWPIVTGHKWNEGVFDWKEILYKLKERGYTNSMLLEVTVIEDRFNNTNRHIVLVSARLIIILLYCNKSPFTDITTISKKNRKWSQRRP